LLLELTVGTFRQVDSTHATFAQLTQHAIRSDPLTF
jgi:hypothetical protein